MMTAALEGQTIDAAKAYVARIQQVLTGATEDVDIGELGELAALQGVKRFPARVKCATLSWHAFEAALAGINRISTETLRPRS